MTCPTPAATPENKLHRLTDILAIATCAVIAGAESWEAIAEYGRTKQAFFRRFLPLDNGIPSADTFGRVFAKLDPAAFARAFGRWMAAACQATGLVPVAIDGKSARAAKRNTATGCLHVVTAWAAENRLVLGTAAVAGRLQRDRRDPRVAPGVGPGRGDRDHRRGRMPGRERPDHPRARGALPAGRQGQPADPAGGRRGGRSTGRARPTSPGSGPTGTRRSRTATGGTRSGT